MAKSARASSKKANRTKLRARVFAPVEKARAERLHAKLVDIIQQPTPERSATETAEDSKSHHHTTPKMPPTDSTTATTAEATKEDGLPKDMDVDGAVTATKTSSKNKDKSQTRKQLRRKPQNKVTFPTSRGKGALKPYNGSRVTKKRS